MGAVRTRVRVEWETFGTLEKRPRKLSRRACPIHRNQAAILQVSLGRVQGTDNFYGPPQGNFALRSVIHTVEFRRLGRCVIGWAATVVGEVGTWQRAELCYIHLPQQWPNLRNIGLIYGIPRHSNILEVYHFYCKKSRNGGAKIEFFQEVRTLQIITVKQGKKLDALNYLRSDVACFACAYLFICFRAYLLFTDATVVSC